jgi:hypothetical protein
MSENWIATEMDQISYRCGGGNSNILEIKNETGDWVRAEYSDDGGDSWNYVLLGFDLINIEPTAQCHQNIIFRPA